MWIENHWTFVNSLANQVVVGQPIDFVNIHIYQWEYQVGQKANYKANLGIT